MNKNIPCQSNVNDFKDLRFRKHCNKYFDKIAHCSFPNGYGLYVLNGDLAYCDQSSYEVALLHNGKTVPFPGTDDSILAYASPERINEIIAEVKRYE